MLKNILYLTKELVRLETVRENRQNIDMAFLLIQRYLKGCYFKKITCKTINSVIVSNVNIDRNIRDFDLILHGHLDVVPANDSRQFQPFEKEGRLYGRGALDMKGGLACLVELMKNINEISRAKKICLLITSDEEVGGECGTKHVFEKIGLRGKFFITAEGEKNYLLKYQQKGILVLKMESFGKGEHAGYTWAGRNAIEQLFSAFQEVKKLFPVRKNKDHWYSTINLGKINGGLAFNSIPAYAEAQIDIRYCQPWRDSEQIFQKIKDRLGPFGKKIIVKKDYQTAMMITDLHNDKLQLLYKTIKANVKTPKNIFFKNHGTNDARFASTVGIAAVGFGPVGGNYHTQDEYVVIKSLQDYYIILKKFLLSI